MKTPQVILLLLASTAVLFVASLGSCFGQTDTNLLAAGDWSPFSKVEMNHNTILATFPSSGIRCVVNLNSEASHISNYNETITLHEKDTLLLTEKHSSAKIIPIFLGASSGLKITISTAPELGSKHKTIFMPAKDTELVGSTNYQKIHIGMSRAEIYQILGKPDGGDIEGVKDAVTEVWVAPPDSQGQKVRLAVLFLADGRAHKVDRDKLNVH